MSAFHHISPQPDYPSWSPNSYDATAAVSGSYSDPPNFEHDDTLKHIVELANQDVDMPDAFPVGALYLVIDTNILIDHLAAIQRFSEDIETNSLPIVIVIPNVVLSELDGLKKRERLGWFAQAASTYILSKVKEWRSVRVQARRETLYLRGDESDVGRKNDIKILDCCCYFKGKGKVVLASGDKNLCIECENESISTISPPPKRSWTSRDIGFSLAQLGMHVIRLEQLRGREDASYRPAPEHAKRTRVTEGRVHQVEDDSMDVDDEYNMGTPGGEFTPSHALDALHWQAIDHFSLVLRNLADRLRAGTGHGELPAQSLHAPWYRRITFRDWSVENCSDYLNLHLEQAKQARLRESTPPVAVFLLRSEGSLRGRRGRRGQDWSRQDWVNVAHALQEIGERFGDEPVLASVRGLRFEMEEVFNSPMRPTGT